MLVSHRPGLLLKEVSDRGHFGLVLQLFEARPAFVAEGRVLVGHGADEGHRRPWQKRQELHQLQEGAVIRVREVAHAVIAH